ncbi:MAG: M24 family metallopeptidase C-terminal domain-containing protein [Comamonadaceae bacterium]|nr:M24 family metallopeptidase C-terminal domain-containing protein [Comamonadaceae bacterium]
MLNVPAPTPDATFGEFLEFETLTLCPIDTRCIERALLRADEIAWLNALPRHGARAGRAAGRRAGAGLAAAADAANLSAAPGATRGGRCRRCTGPARRTGRGARSSNCPRPPP